MTLTIGIDPRIRARRIAVRRAEGRRRLRFLLNVLAAIALLPAAYGVTRTPLLDVDRVDIPALPDPRAAQVAAIVDGVGGTPLLDVDLGAIETELAALPWVAQARAVRDWPGTLRLEVTEREPLATVLGVDGRLLVDASGVVIGPATADDAVTAIALASDASPGAVEPAALPALALVEALPGDLLPWVERVTVAASSSATAPTVGIDLVGLAEAELGEPVHLGDKLLALRSVLAGADLACVRTIDVTIADLPTVRRDPVCDGRATPEDAAAATHG